MANKNIKLQVGAAAPNYSVTYIMQKVVRKKMIE